LKQRKRYSQRDGVERFRPWFLVAAALAVPAAWGAAQLLLNVNTQSIPQSSDPAFLGTARDAVIFAASNPEQSRLVLWRSDGTEAGTVQVGGLEPRVATQAGGANANGRVIYVASGATPDGGRLASTDGTAAGSEYLTNDTDVLLIRSVGKVSTVRSVIVSRRFSRQQLLSTDGTRAGTITLREQSTPVQEAGAVQIGSVLYFVDQGDDAGEELWRTDGTVAGTRIVRDIEVGIEGSRPRIMGVSGRYLFFRATTSAFGEEIWRVDSATDAATLLADIVPGEDGYVPQFFAALPNGAFVFSIDSELWFSNGTPGSAQRVIDFVPGEPDEVEILGSTGSRALLRARSGSSGSEVWSTDGSATGTILLREHTPGPLGTMAAIVGTLNVGVVLSLGSEDGTNQSFWRSDGTVAGTQQIVPTSSAVIGSNPLVIVGSPGQLWRIDRSTAAARAEPYSIQLGVLSEDLKLGERYFFDTYTPNEGFEPGVSDGTTAGTRVLRDIVPQTGDESSAPGEFTTVGGVTFFSASTRAAGRELWKTDGTPAGTVLVRDITPGEAGSAPAQLRAVGGVLYFIAFHPQYGYEPWISDGTAAGTRLLRDIAAGSASSVNPSGAAGGCGKQWLGGVAGRVYFGAGDGVTGQEIWTSDGTEAGTRLVRDIVPGAQSSSPCDFSVVNGVAVFRAFTAATGSEFFRSDGTEGGTQLLIDLRPGADSSFVRNMTTFGRYVYFERDLTGGNTNDIWRTDGTTAGTTRFLDGSDVTGLRTAAIAGILADRIYFGLVANSSNSGLYSSAGVASDLILVSSQCGASSRGVATAGRLFLPSSGLCVTDGSAAGTRVVRDGLGVLQPVDGESFAALNGVVYFLGRENNSASAVWKSDGSAAGTVSIATFLPFPPQQAPAIAGGRPVFVGTDARTGAEPWTFTGNAPRAADDAASTTAGSVVTVDVLANDSDSDGRLLPNSLRIVQGPANGTAVVTADNRISYTSAAAFTGTDRVQYSISDDFGFESAPATVTFSVAAAPSGGGGNSGSGGGGSGGGGGGISLSTLGLLMLLCAYRLFALCRRRAAAPGYGGATILDRRRPRAR
jgi:trimeric autotransporter adhesin